MTENKDQNTSYDESEAYLYEPFTTEDDIVVPPPTRPMGPRRLTRYRTDAAEYLRALKNGEQLPDEPVAYMGALEDDESVSAESAAAHQRLSALAAQGSIESAASDESTLNKVQGNGTAKSTVAQSDPTLVGLDDSSLVFDDEVETGPAAVDADDQVHETEVVVSDPLTQHDGEDASAEIISPLESDELVDAGESEDFSAAASEPAVDEGVHETEVVEVTDSALSDEEQDAPVEEYTPETVSALSAQGLDLTPVAFEFSEFTDDELLGEDAQGREDAPVQEHDSFEGVEVDSTAVGDSQEFEDLRGEESYEATEPQDDQDAAASSERSEVVHEEAVAQSQFDVAQIGSLASGAKENQQLADESATPAGYVQDSTEVASSDSSTTAAQKSTSAVWLPLVLIIMALIIFGIYFFMNNG